MGFSAHTQLFSDFCQMLTRIRESDRNSNVSKTSILTDFLAKLKEECPSEMEFQKEIALFSALFLPDSNEARKFDMGSKKLADLVSRVLQIPSLKTASDKAPSRVADKLAAEVSSRISGSPAGSTFTVQNMVGKLDELCQAKGESRDNLLAALFQTCSQNELVWIFNIIMRNVESFAGYNRRIFLSCLSPAANDAWTNSRDLRNLSSLQDDSDKAPDHYLGANFAPMLLARLTHTNIDEHMQYLTGGFYLETKYDGEHVVMHKRGDEYKWFTRNGKDYTEHYGGSKSEKVAARIHPFFQTTLYDCVIDCELMHYEESTGKMIRHLDKAATKDGIVLNYRNPQPGHRIVVVVFDLLYFRGNVRGETFSDDLTRTPLSDRIQVMRDRLLKREDPANIFIVSRKEGTTGDDIRSFFDEAMANSEEGIAVKRMDSLYFPGQRTKRNGWFKLKDKFDMDLVLVGTCKAVDKGNGYLLAAWDESPNFNLRVICKAYAGLTDIDKKKIYSDAHRDGALLSSAPDGLYGWSNDPSYQYLRKNDWLVVEATSHGVRNGHLIDVVMRRIRHDKDICIEDIDSYRAIKKHQPGEFAVRGNSDGTSSSDSSNGVTKVKRVTTGDVFAQSVVPEKRVCLEVETPLTGKTVCVLAGYDDALRKKCWSILEKFGAKAVANPNSDTVLLVAPSPKHMRVTSSIKKNTLSIVDAKWLVRCEQNQNVDKWLPEDLIHEVEGGFTI